MVASSPVPLPYFGMQKAPPAPYRHALPSSSGASVHYHPTAHNYFLDPLGRPYAYNPTTQSVTNRPNTAPTAPHRRRSQPQPEHSKGRETLEAALTIGPAPAEGMYGYSYGPRRADDERPAGFVRAMDPPSRGPRPAVLHRRPVYQYQPDQQPATGRTALTKDASDHRIPPFAHVSHSKTISPTSRDADRHGRKRSEDRPTSRHDRAPLRRTAELSSTSSSASSYRSSFSSSSLSSSSLSSSTCSSSSASSPRPSSVRRSSRKSAVKVERRPSIPRRSRRTSASSSSSGSSSSSSDLSSSSGSSSSSPRPSSSSSSAASSRLASTEAAVRQRQRGRSRAGRGARRSRASSRSDSSSSLLSSSSGSSSSSSSRSSSCSLASSASAARASRRRSRSSSLSSSSSSSSSRSSKPRRRSRDRHSGKKDATERSSRISRPPSSKRHVSSSPTRARSLRHQNRTSTVRDTVSVAKPSYRSTDSSPTQTTSKRTPTEQLLDKLARIHGISLQPTPHTTGSLTLHDQRIQRTQAGLHHARVTADPLAQIQPPLPYFHSSAAADPASHYRPALLNLSLYEALQLRDTLRARVRALHRVHGEALEGLRRRQWEMDRAREQPAAEWTRQQYEEMQPLHDEQFAQEEQEETASQAESQAEAECRGDESYELPLTVPSLDSYWYERKDSGFSEQLRLYNRILADLDRTFFS